MQQALTEEQHLKNAALLVRAMMSSASSEKIRRIEWWERAKSAIETAAMSSDSFPSLVSTMARKLQIDCTTIATASDIVLLGEVVAHNFEAFRRFCERHAVYIVALVQAEKKAARDAKQQTADESDGGDVIEEE